MSDCITEHVINIVKLTYIFIPVLFLRPKEEIVLSAQFCFLDVTVFKQMTCGRKQHNKVQLFLNLVRNIPYP